MLGTRFRSFITLLVLANLFLVSNVLAQTQCPTLAVDDKHARQSINHYLCYAVTNPGEPAHSALSPQQLPQSLEWRSSAGNDLVFSHTKAIYWIKLRLNNPGDSQSRWYLMLNYPPLDEITFWQKPGPHSGATTPSPLKTGDHFPFESRGIDYRYYLLPITLAENETTTLYIRVHSSGALNVPLSLMTPDEAIEQSNHLTLIHGLFYGALVILAVFNLLLYASSGTRYYFLNAFYTASMAMFLFAMGGFANQYFWPDNFYMANLSIPFLLGVIALAMILFGWSFLEVPRRTRSGKSLRVLAWCAAGLLALTCVIPYSTSIQINTIFLLAVILLLSIIATIRWRGGYQPAFWYLAAWMVMVAGSLIYAAAAFGYMGDYQAREVMMQAVVGAQVVLLNYALVQRWRLLNEKLLGIEHQARNELEVKVHERTYQLRTAMYRLEQANRKLEALSLNDALTGLHNRRHMDNLLPELCLEAQRTGKPLTLALLDADHFKRVNDTWGHDFGDACLRMIAGILTDHVKRPRDVAVRFGGEEFALLLPDTDIEGAARLCNDILKTMRNTPVRAPDGSQITITLSAGLAELAGHKNAQALFQSADEALYASKHRGRDTLTFAETAPHITP
ncbi:diguanylate cyclase [Marinobacter litoralis]|uniref:sensor domain-containing diguanylate cyclase n=1 Tax=Marinobacter litoralis TaxID=187981 RepID=UPI0018EADC64|nr:diguanylate cyclase [Marinobacter litoralis]MBJ6137579.1 GGDEF domain-containing protein [Marinobacter litoralis]